MSEDLLRPLIIIMNKIIASAVMTMALFGTVAFAEEQTLPKPGMTPASPFFFLERFFEKVGTFFTFGEKVKNERLLTLAEERLAEAKALAEEGNAAAADALGFYGEQLSDLAQRGGKDVERATKLAEATERHYAVLEDIRKRALTFARSSVEEAFATVEDTYKENIATLSEVNPELALGIGLEDLRERVDAALDTAEERSGEGLERAKTRIDQSLRVLETARHNHPELETEFSEGLTSVIDLLNATSTRDGTRAEDVELIRERVVAEQLASLRKILEQDPAQAAGIYSDIIKSRLEAGKDAFQQEDQESGETILEGIEQYQQFGEELPARLKADVNNTLNPAAKMLERAQEQLKNLPHKTSESDDAMRALDDAIKTLQAVPENLR